jgi:Spy/CpxP family protein refolding chaperone
MNNRATTLFLTGLLATLFAGSTVAQEAPSDRRGRDLKPLDVEAIMSAREGLELTEEQVAALDAVRAEEVARRNTERAEVEEMRSRLRAGMIPRSEMMAFMEDRQATRQESGSDRQQRIDGILTPDQRTGLEQMRAERRAFERGRRAGRSGARAARGSRGFERGWNRGIRRGPGSDRGFDRERRGPGDTRSPEPTDPGQRPNGPFGEPR